ncbi:MAG: glucosaminidase domain-containing protein [Saprospirales bacterium]|nr:glucosaminidase domain-containing protein [Saprospirales bacterium]
MENAFTRACFFIFLSLAGGKLHTQSSFPNLEANSYLEKVVPEIVLTYLNENLPLATQVSKIYGIPADFLLCVSGLETGWGKSELSRMAHNHFGIKNHYQEGPSYCVMHVDFVPGVGNVEEIDCFKQYASPLESFMDYAAHLQRRSCYLEIQDRAFAGFQDWAQVISGCGYATDPDYGQKLREIRNKYFISYLVPSAYEYNYTTAR